MSVAGGTPTQIQSLRAVDSGGGRKHRGHSRGRQAAGNAVPGPAQAITPTLVSPAEPEDGTVCWICAELVKIYSISECNHRTCHVCALRLRALYKRMDCTFCKVNMFGMVLAKFIYNFMFSIHRPLWSLLGLQMICLTALLPRGYLSKTISYLSFLNRRT
jgi:Zinc finger, C3HC4 type (RING finger)